MKLATDLRTFSGDAHNTDCVWVQLETFYKGLKGQTRSIVYASSGGSNMMKSYEKAYNC